AIDKLAAGFIDYLDHRIRHAANLHTGQMSRCLSAVVGQRIECLRPAAELRPRLRHVCEKRPALDGDAAVWLIESHDSEARDFVVQLLQHGLTRLMRAVGYGQYRHRMAKAVAKVARVF